MTFATPQPAVRAPRRGPRRRPSRRGGGRRPLKRYSPPGTSPGTVTAPAAGAAHLSLFAYGPDRFSEIEVRGVRDALAKLPPDTQGWLRIVGHDAAVLAELAEQMHVHPLVLEDVVNIGQRPKMEDHETYVFVVVDVITAGTDGALEEEQLSLLLFDRLVVSVQERPSALFRLVEERVRSDRGKMRTMGPDYLAYALIDAAVDHFFPLLERIAARVEEIEDVLLDQPGPETVQVLHQMRRDLLRVRRSIWPLRDMLGSLSRLDSPLVREGTRVWLRDRLRPLGAADRHHRVVPRDRHRHGRAVPVEPLEPPEPGHEGPDHHRHDLHPADVSRRHLRHELQPRGRAAQHA
jgi:magnesium transporter